MKILIQGAGVAGLALANALQQKGITPTVIEKYPDKIPEGYWIYISDNGRQVLRKFGLEKELDEHAYSIPGLEFVNTHGKRLQYMDFTKNLPKYALPVSIDRPRINHILQKPIKNIPIKRKVTILAIDQKTDGAYVELSDGTKEVYDVVVGADGFNSGLRTLVFPEIIKEYYGMHLWLFNVKIKDFEISPVLYSTMGRGVFVSVLPNGSQNCIVYLLIKAPKGKYGKSNLGINFIHSKLKGYNEPFNSISPHLSHRNLVYQTDLQKIETNEWASGRVVIIGDAQHAMSQITGQGGALALEDAYVLAHELTKSKTRSVKQSIRVFENKRQKRVEFMQVFSNKIMFFIRVQSRGMVLFRNVFLRKLVSPNFLLDNLQARLSIKVIDD